MSTSSIFDLFLLLLARRTDGDGSDVVWVFISSGAADVTSSHQLHDVTKLWQTFEVKPSRNQYMENADIDASNLIMSASSILFFYIYRQAHVLFLRVDFV